MWSSLFITQLNRARERLGESPLADVSLGYVLHWFTRFKYVPAHLRYVFITPQGTSEYLNRNHFARVVLMVIGLHIMGLYVWYLSPKTKVVDVPVRALNIKLGDIDMPDDNGDVSFTAPDAGNSTAVEKTLSKLVEGVKMRDEEKPADQAVADDTQKGKQIKHAKEVDEKKAAPQPKQYIRPSQNVVPESKLFSGRSAATTAEIMRRYEQVISQWIQKFKLYPDEARAQGMEGETVIRIRIDRQGNIRYHALERSTGFQLLDRAAIAMIRRANPVPAVPHDYPPGDQMEFLIPVTFHLK